MTTKTAKQLESELGRSEAISAFVAECAVQINAMAPEFDYKHADLSGFVRGCWPCDDLPIDVAAEFVEAVTKQRDE